MRLTDSARRVMPVLDPQSILGRQLRQGYEQVLKVSGHLLRALSAIREVFASARIVLTSLDSRLREH